MLALTCALALCAALEGPEAGATPRTAAASATTVRRTAPDTVLVLEIRWCYVVCSTVTALFLADGSIERVLKGERLGAGRQPVPVGGGDTLRVGATALELLVRDLVAVRAEHRDRTFAPGQAPCSDEWVSHSPQYDLRWRVGGSAHGVHVTMACQGLPADVRQVISRASELGGLTRWPPAT